MTLSVPRYPFCRIFPVLGVSCGLPQEITSFMQARLTENVMSNSDQKPSTKKTLKDPKTQRRHKELTPTSRYNPFFLIILYCTIEYLNSKVHNLHSPIIAPHAMPHSGIVEIIRARYAALSHPTRPPPVRRAKSLRV